MKITATSGPLVAIVDDDPSVRTALSRLLQAESMRVETFASAREFLASCAERVPMCLVLDVHLGEMSGLELQDHLAANGPEMAVILMTAHDEVPSNELASRVGKRNYLRKPFEGDALVALVRRAIGQSPDDE